ncbi:MAG TPA: serine hydrolase [Candidatus Limnocylindria bacterium]
MTRLLERFVERARAAGGRVGAIVIASDGSEALAVDPDGVYFAASVIKIPLVMTLFADAAAGLLTLDERVAVGARVDGSGVLRDLRDVEPLTLRDLAALTMTVSDNTATNRLIERIGVDRVNERLDEWGCPRTRLQRAMFDMDAKARGCENLMTPRETASLLSRIARDADRGTEPGVSVLALMKRNTNLLRLGRYLPGSVTLAHKDGWGEDPDPVNNDVGIVTAKTSMIVAGFTHRVDTALARPLLGLLGLAVAELAGADTTKLPIELAGGA